MNSISGQESTLKNLLPSFVTHRVDNDQNSGIKHENKFSDFFKQIEETRQSFAAQQQSDTQKADTSPTLSSQESVSSHKRNDQQNRIEDKTIENRSAEKQSKTETAKNKKTDNTKPEDKELSENKIDELKKNLAALMKKLEEGEKSGETTTLLQKIDELSTKIESLLTKNSLTTEEQSQPLKKMDLIRIKHQLAQLKQMIMKDGTHTEIPKSLKDSIKELIKGLTPEKNIAAQTTTNSKESVTLNPTHSSDQAIAHVSDQKSTSNKGATAGGDNSYSMFGESKETKLSEMRTQTNHSQTKQSSLFKDQIHDLMKKAQVVVKDEKNGSINLKMYPERLGSVTINFGLENGTLSGKFLVDSKEAKELLLSQFDQIKDRLSEEGIELGEFSVNVKDGGAGFTDYKERRDTLDALNNNSKFRTQASDEYNSSLLNSKPEYHDGSLNIVM